MRNLRFLFNNHTRMSEESIRCCLQNGILCKKTEYTYKKCLALSINLEITHIFIVVDDSFSKHVVGCHRHPKTNTKLENTQQELIITYIHITWLHSVIHKYNVRRRGICDITKQDSVRNELKKPPVPASTHPAFGNPGSNPANAIKSHTTQHNDHSTPRTLDPHCQAKQKC